MNGAAPVTDPTRVRRRFAPAVVIGVRTPAFVAGRRLYQIMTMPHPELPHIVAQSSCAVGTYTHAPAQAALHSAAS